MSVGPEFTGATSLALTPLAPVLPGTPLRFRGSIEETFKPWVSELGQRHPVTQGLTGANPAGDPKKGPEWGQWYRRIQTNEVHGDVLMATPNGQPLLVLGHEGKGRTALLLSDQIWLWSRGHDGGGPQGELLRRIAHWLMQEPSLEENALTARIDDGVLVVERRALGTEPVPPIKVSLPSKPCKRLATSLPVIWSSYAVPFTFSMPVY